MMMDLTTTNPFIDLKFKPIEKTSVQVDFKPWVYRNPFFVPYSSADIKFQHPSNVDLFL